MQEIKIKVYKFEELKENVQERVIEKFRNGNDYFFLEDVLNERFYERLKEEGIEETGKTELSYSLGWSQGDGTSFTGKFSWKGIEISIVRNTNHYCHSNTTDLTFYDKEGEEIDNDKTKEFEDLYHEVCDYIESEGYAFIDNENDKDVIAENIECNEYQFLVNGDIFYSLD